MDQFLGADITKKVTSYQNSSLITWKTYLDPKMSKRERENL